MSLTIVWIQKQGQVGTLVLDAVISSSHTMTNTPTKNPVEEGAQVTDHVQLEPLEISIEGAISNTPNVIRQGPPPTLADLGDKPYPLGQPGRSKEAFDTLKKLRDERTLVTVLAPPLAQYDNMLVKSVSVPDQKGETLMFTVVLVELRIVTTQRVRLPKAKAPRGKGGPVNEGKKTGKTAPPTEVGGATEFLRWLTGDNKIGRGR